MVEVLCHSNGDRPRPVAALQRLALQRTAWRSSATLRWCATAVRPPHFLAAVNIECNPKA